MRSGFLLAPLLFCLLASAQTKRVAGENLSASAFAYVGDARDPRTWKLPIQFSTEEKTKAHIRSALARLRQTNLPESEKPAVRARIEAAAKAHGVAIKAKDTK